MEYLSSFATSLGLILALMGLLITGASPASQKLSTLGTTLFWVGIPMFILGILAFYVP